MATPEFRETGQTQNQRLRAMNSDIPPAPQGDARMDRVVQNMMEKIPALQDFQRQTPASEAAPATPATDPHADLTTEELMVVYKRVAGSGHSLDPAAASRLTRMMGDLSGQ